MSTTRATLVTHYVKDVPLLKGKVIEIDSTMHLEEAFGLIVDNNILSAPVWDAAAGHYLGFLDVRDLVAFAVFASKENDLVQSLKEIVNHGAKLHAKAQDGITVSYLARRNPFKPVTGEASLFDVCKILATGTHRVPVVDHSGKVINIISQSSIISFLVHHTADDDFLKKTLQDLSLGTSPVVAVNDQDTALKTFTKLDDTGRSGIAVVDSEGVLVGNTSGSDIKLYLKYHESLNQPIIEFLHKIRRLDLTTRAPIFTCKMEDSIYKVVGKLGATKAHRVFIVDEEFRPVRVVSLTDILRALLKA